MTRQNNICVGARIRNLRQRSNISLRQLSRTADVSVSYLSAIEKDAVSPTLAMLRKILTALDSNFYDFFNDECSQADQYILRKAGMQTAADSDREYTLLLPHREDIRIELMDENYFPGKELPAFEVFESDFAGYVISGELVLEVDNEPPTALNAGDAFYVPAGTKVRGYCEKERKARLITALYPRGCFNCPEKVSTLEKVSDYRKLLIAPRCSEIISK